MDIGDLFKSPTIKESEANNKMTFFTIIFAIASIVFAIVTVGTATLVIRIDGERTAVFYGWRAFRWYRKNCGTKRTKYQLIKIEGLF